MINFIKLYQEIQPYRITDEALMPYAYSSKNPQGRPYHGDWALFKKTRRMDTAYKVPMPFRKVAGTQEPIWTAWNGSYPIAPDTQIQVRPYYTDKGETIDMPHVLTMHPVYDKGWSRQEAFINGRWQEVYYSSSRQFLGNRLTYYYGLKLDPHITDCMAWFPELSGSIKWVKKSTS